MPIRFADLPSFDQINLGATLVLAAVMAAFAFAVTGVWLTHRRPAMQALAAYWGLFGVAAVLNIFSSWSGAIWRDRVLSLTLTGMVVALHAAAAPFARSSVQRLARLDAGAPALHLAVLVGTAVFMVHHGGVLAALHWWPDVRLAPVLLSRGVHAVVYLVPALLAWQQVRAPLRNRTSLLLLAIGLSALAARGVLEFVLGLGAAKPDVSEASVAFAIAFNLLGVISLGVASLIAMAAEEQQVVRRQAEELRRAEQSRQQGQRLESLGRLASGVAHDFNNVLMVIMAATDTLRKEVTTRAQMVEVESLTEAYGRGRGLLRQLLTFARQQPGAGAQFDANAHLRAMAAMLERLAGTCLVRVEPAGTQAPVFMDPVNFDQVVFNLVANARDASADGTRITVSTAVHATPAAGVLAARGDVASVDAPVTPGAWVCLSVEDSGTGIPADVLPYVFEPFFSTKPQDLGTGLGLATVLGIVARAGGDVVVNSEVGRGTRFEVWLPMTA